MNQNEQNGNKSPRHQQALVNIAQLQQRRQMLANELQVIDHAIETNQLVADLTKEEKCPEPATKK